MAAKFFMDDVELKSNIWAINTPLLYKRNIYDFTSNKILAISLPNLRAQNLLVVDEVTINITTIRVQVK